VFRQRHEASIDAPIACVYDALLAVLARRRWGGEAWFDPLTNRPIAGRSYVFRNGSVVRRGRVVECRQPVLLTLYEALFDPPCRVRLRLRWRLEPLDRVTLLRLDARYELNSPAYLNRKRWREEIAGQSARLHAAVRATVGDTAAQGVGANGHRTGSSTMTVTKTTAVNGRPTFK